VPHSTQLHEEQIAACTPAPTPRVPVVRKHHVLVRISHWLTIPLLLGLIVSGVSIYWASPIYQHNTDPQTGSLDYLADAGIWICAHVPGAHDCSSHPDWTYSHISLGPYMLAPALRLHWCCAYLFMLNGLVYLAGILLGGEWRALLPRLSDARGAVKMVAYYAGTPLAILKRQPRKPPRQSTKYNPLQRLAYFSIPIAGLLSVLTGWAIHKPMQFSRLAAVFGGFESARVWHFWLMWIFVLFVIPHVILVFAEGWDTLRSMITGWSRIVQSGGQANEG
jgi:thiosulfate reductase cytochrome b subunit